MSINRSTLENFGSLLNIEYVPSFGIANFIPEINGNIPAGNLTLKAGFDWQYITCSADTAGHEQSQNSNDQGESWSQQVSGFVTGDEPSIEAGLLAMSGRKYIIRVTLMNGVQKIIGNPGEPLDFSYRSSTQDSVPGRPGTQINFSGITLSRALFLTA